MMLRVSAFALLFSCLFVSGCSQSISPRGDATTRGSGQLRTTKLPVFPIGSTGTHEFRVSGLEVRQFPFKFRFFTTRANGSELILNTPFEDSVIRVEIVSDSGSILAGKTVRPTTWRHTGQGEFEQYFWGRGEPALDYLACYKVRVTVLKPSSREWDKAQLYLR
ncbi:MAG: hypothetical protein P1U86_03045 [Verrucomicrobiales bacterium]|nr:hypothetical protein [Verrucomicrobiales bacterium]